MPDGNDATTIKVIDRIADADAAQWDACAGADNPFVSHLFLNALEESGAVSGETGWQPQHLVVESSGGTLLGAVPCYLKNHSYGEYVFDWGWADAFERAGGTYYPKLQVSVPFTPVTGPRLLLRPGPVAEETGRVLVAGLMELARQRKVSSLHITFPTEAEWHRLGDAGFLQRIGKQFHWENRGYDSFDDFLATLSSRKRKGIRKERRQANEAVDIEVLTGAALEPRHMDAFYGFYLNTVDRKWANAYLNRAFFRLLQERMADRLVLVMASHDGAFVGGALNMLGADTLYGRNWGAAGRFRFLYFEACFYRAIEFAIAHGLKYVEAGAQGPHKISRGYLPTTTYSAHWIRDAGFRDAVAEFVDREQDEVTGEMAILERHRSPYRKDGGGGG
jgi:predicted N-acyltransferase